MSGIRKSIKTAIVTVNIQKSPFAKKIFIVFLLLQMYRKMGVEVDDEWLNCSVEIDINQTPSAP